MSLKSFSIKLLAFAILLLASDRIAGLGLKSLYARAGDKFERENYMRHEMVADCIIMGSSKAAHHYKPSVICDSLDMTVYNCGQRGNGVVYAYGRLATIYQRYTPKVIILDVIKDYDLDVNDNVRFLDFLKPDYGHNSTVDSLFYDLDSGNKYKMLLYSYQYNSTICDLLINTLFTRRARFGKDGYFPLVGAKSDFVPLAIDNFERIDESIVTDSVKVSYLERIAQEHRPGCLLVYTISPTYRHVDIKAYKAVRDICSRYHIPLLDYENDDRFLGQYDLYYDGSHLNDKGAELYSSIVACDIKTLIREKE